MIGLLAVLLAQDATATKEGLEATIRALHRGMAAQEPDARLKALKAVLPARKDVEVLLPAHADKLWPRWEAQAAAMEKAVDKVAQEMTAKGALQGVELKALQDDDRGRRALDLLPKGTAAYDYVLRYEKGSSGGSTYVHVHGRWVLLRGLSSLPDLLEKLK